MNRRCGSRSLQCFVKREKNKYINMFKCLCVTFTDENILLLFSIAFVPLAEDAISISLFSTAYSMKP